MIKEHYDSGITARRPYEERWIINLAFLTGHQYSFFNRSSHTIQMLRRVKGRKRSIDNQLLPRWRRQIADLIKNDPIMSVVPNSTDDEDIKAAKAGDKVLKHFWRQDKMKKTIRQLAGWIHSCGSGFLDDRWDPKKGPTQVDPDTGKLIYLGDATCGVWSPFEVVVPTIGLAADELHDLPWIIKCKWRDLYWIKRQYKRGDAVVAEQQTTPIINMATILGNPPPPTENNPGAMVIDFYMMPNAEFPKGLFATGSNGIMLQEDDYPLTSYHMEHFKDIDVPGVFWGMATLEAGVKLQRTWNNTLSSIDQFNTSMGKGKYLAPRGSQMEQNPDDTHGEVVYYKPVMGYRPEQMTQKGLPPTYDLMLKATRASLEDLYSQHEVSRGTNRSDIRSGLMVQELREQDAHGNIPAHAVFEESLEASMSRVLQRVQAGYKTQRMIKVIGRDGEFEVSSFQGSDLRNNTDVAVKKQSSLPDSRAVREAIILEKFEKGLYGDPADPEVRRHVMNMLEDAVVKDIYSDARLDEAYARWENNTMMNPEAEGKYLVNSYDNHMIHVKEHNHHRKSMDYQRLKTDNYEQFMINEKAFETHIKMHQGFIKQMQEAMLKKQIALQKGGKAA
jgi:hypothetical protein